MARRRTGRRYTAEQKREVIRRVQSGESQVAIAKATGISSWTVGQWVRKAKAGAKIGRKAGRPRAARPDRPRQEIAWALDGDVLVVRIPLRRFVRQLAQKALAKI